LVFAHDLTEGGLVAGLWELTRGTSLGIEASFPESYLDQELIQLSRRSSLTLQNNFFGFCAAGLRE